MKLLLCPSSDPGQLASCSGRTCCDHLDCAQLKERRWCRHWFFLRWISPPAARPWGVIDELRERLGERSFRVYAAISRTGVCEAMLRVEPDGVLDSTPSPCPLPTSFRFDAGRSRTWQLPCCLDAVHWNVPVWLACFRETGDRVLLGDRGVLASLLDEVRHTTAIREDRM